MLLAAVRAKRAKIEAARRQEEIRRDRAGVAARCKSLHGFVREAWHIVEPQNAFVDGRVIEAICQHLEAVTRGEITRLVINVPPGMMKSLLVTVFWPAWEWATKSASLRYVSTTFDANNAVRDTRRMRFLVSSEWYRALFPKVGALIRNSAASFENAHTGWREASAFGSLTGKRGDRLLIDDPHSTKMAESDAIRNETQRVFREDVPSRINDARRSAIIIIMQRVHVEDVAALAIEQGYTLLRLPMEFEAESRCSTKIGFSDWRELEGDLLFPARFPREAVDRDKAAMLEHAVAGQYQQRPVPREGNLFKRAWFDGRLVPAAPDDCVWWRHWDLAASLKNPKLKNQAWTAGVKMGFSPSTRRYYVGHVSRFQEEGHTVRANIKAQAELDGKRVKISLPQDPGAGGKFQSQDIVASLAGYVASSMLEEGDKFSRAEPFAAQCGAGNVFLVSGAWVQAYVDELCIFPSSAAKDQVDASSGAFKRLAQSPRMTWAPPISNDAPRNLPA